MNISVLSSQSLRNIRSYIRFIGPLILPCVENFTHEGRWKRRYIRVFVACKKPDVAYGRP